MGGKCLLSVGGNGAPGLSAASHALQNVLALVSADIALAAHEHMIPFDEVLEAHRWINANIAREARCTSDCVRCG